MDNMLNFKYTANELEIIKLIALGLSNKEISKALYMSVSTVKSHLENIYRKTGVNNRVLLAIFALKNGYLN